MKLFCPYCGLKGTANDSLYNKKVNCPDCEKHFVIDCAVIAGPHQNTASPKAESDLHESLPPEIVEEFEITDNSPEENLEAQESADSENKQVSLICSSCGVFIEAGTEYMLGSGTYCPDCRPSGDDDQNLDEENTTKKRSSFFASLFKFKKKQK